MRYSPSTSQLRVIPKSDVIVWNGNDDDHCNELLSQTCNIFHMCRLQIGLENSFCKINTIKQHVQKLNVSF